MTTSTKKVFEVTVECELTYYVYASDEKEAKAMAPDHFSEELQTRCDEPCYVWGLKECKTLDDVEEEAHESLVYGAPGFKSPVDLLGDDGEEK